VPRATSPRTDRLGNPFDETMVKPDTSRALVMSPGKGMKKMSIRDLPAKVMKEAAAIFDGTQAILAEDLPPN
jgi:hypothetical protein